MHRQFFLLFFLAVCTASAAERINQEGRILGPAPVVTTPTLFNTAAADAIVSAMQIYPLDNPWNEDISNRPLLSNSSAMITQITSDLASSRRNLRLFTEMNYVLVPDNQPNVPISFFNYPDESDPSPYPIPTNLPIETWPVETGNLTLLQWQEDINNDGGDRHAIMVMPGQGKIWETWLTQLVSGAWQASNGAKFDLKSDTLRPAGWTSGDAAGLSMFQALVRYDECQRGMVEHAMRLVVVKSRKQNIYPATHQAGSVAATSVNYPAMGQRLRLKASFPIPATWTIYEKAVALALKKYGAIVADNGGFFSISICPDDRYPSGAFDNLSSIGVSNFEVIQTTGPTEGPRSPGAPTASAGAATTIVWPANSVNLAGVVTGTNLTVQWKQYSSTGTATFTNAAQAATKVTFSQPGTYTLMLNASDGVHAVARDAVTINVTVPVSVGTSGSNRVVTFGTANGQNYSVERATSLAAAGNWSTLASGIVGNGSAAHVSDPNVVTSGQVFYRVRIGQ